MDKPQGLTDLEQAAGKQLHADGVRSGFTGDAFVTVLVFTDDTFVAFCAVEGDWDEGPSVKVLSALPAFTLYNVGLIDDEEYQVLREWEQEQDEAERLARQRRQYERLKRVLGLEGD